MHKIIMNEKEVDALFSLLEKRRELSLWSGKLFYTPFVNPCLLEDASENDYYNKYGDSLVIETPLMILLITHLLNGICLQVKYTGEARAVGVYKLSRKAFLLMNNSISDLKSVIKEAFKSYREKDQEGAILTASILYAALNNYILEGDHTEEVPEVERTHKQGKKRTKKKYHKSNSISIDRCYKVVFPEKEDAPNQEPKESHKIEYTCECWEVRGFYRTYKSGRRIYVAPYLKGKNKDKGVPWDKTFHIHPSKEEEE